MHVTIRSLACLAVLVFLALSASGQRTPANVDPQEIGVQQALLPQQSLVPGGVALVRIDGAADRPPRVGLDGAPVMVLRQDDHWLAVIGVPLGTPPGKLKVTVEQRDALLATMELVIKPKQYVVQRLRVAPGMVELAPDDLATVIDRALSDGTCGLGERGLSLEESGRAALLDGAAGDGRAALTALEFESRGVGSAEPLSAGDSEADKQRNRRVAVRIHPLGAS